MSDDIQKKSKAPGIIVTVIVLALAAAAVIILTQRSNAAKMEVAMDEAQEEQVFAVNTTEAVKGQINDYLYVNGDISARETVDVYPDTAGKLVQIAVSPGTRVRKGDVLAYIDPSRPGMTYSNSPVYSPIAGTVTSFPGNIGTMVSAQAAIATIGDLTNLRVKTYISERKVSMIALGMPAELTFEAYPGVKFPAKITEISPVIDPSSRTMEIKLDMTAKETRIKSGMFARIRITTAIKENVVKIPSDCIIERFDERFVYVVNTEDRVEKRIISEGISFGDVSEIVSGLNPGEKVVYQGQTLLENGVKVKVVKEVQPLSVSADKEG